MRHEESKLSNILVAISASGISGVLLYTLYLVVEMSA